MTPPADPLTDVVLDRPARSPPSRAPRPCACCRSARARTAGPRRCSRLGALAVPVEEYRCTDVDDAALRGLRAGVTDPGYLRLDRLDPRRPLDGRGSRPAPTTC